MQKIIVCSTNQGLADLSKILLSGEWKVIHAFSRSIGGGTYSHDGDMIFVLEKTEENQFQG